MTEVEAYLREALALIEREACEFPGDDGIGAGAMARNALARADQIAANQTQAQEGTS